MSQSLKSFFSEAALKEEAKRSRWSGNVWLTFHPFFYTKNEGCWILCLKYAADEEKGQK